MALAFVVVALAFVVVALASSVVAELLVAEGQNVAEWVVHCEKPLVY